MTWANQIRILAQQFQQLGKVIGGVLINAFKPFISALNTVMQAVISFAETVANALGVIFGWTIRIDAGGLANDFEYAADAADDIADGTGAAADNAEKLNTYIAGWQEVNNMTTSDDSDSGGGGGGGADTSGAADAAEAQLVQMETIFDKYESAIDNLYDLGKYIGEVLTNAMNSIDWDSVYQGARNFGTGLAQFLNGLISPDLFGAVGRTIAGALNTALHFLDSFGVTFDWKNFGNSIATGINNFFGTFDFSLLAHTINTWAKGILETAITAIQKTDWKKIGTEIGNFLKKIDFTDIGKKLGKLLWEAINAGIDFYKSMFKSAPIETAIITVLTGAKILAKVKPAAETLGKSILSILGKAIEKGLGDIWTGITLGPSMIPTGIKDAINDFSKTIISGVSKLNTGMKAALGAATIVGEVALIKDAFSDLMSGEASIADVIFAIGEIGIAVGAVKTVLVGAFGAAGPVIGAIAGVAAAFAGIDEAMTTAANNSAIGQFSQAISDLNDEVFTKTESINQSLQGIRENVETAGGAEAQMARDLAAEYETLSGKTELTASEKERLKEVSQNLVDIIPSLQGYIDNETGALNIQKGTLDALIEGYEALAKKQAAQEMLVDAYKAQYEAQMNVKNATEGYNEAFNEYLANAGLAPDVIQQVADGQLDLNQAMIDFENSPKEFLQKYGVKDYGTLKKAVDGVSTAMTGYKTTLDEAKETEKAAGETLNDLHDIMAENEQAIAKATTKDIEAKKATDEYKQSISDLTTDMGNLGIVLSESLMEDLALGDYDSSGLKTFFDSLESGVAQSSTSLQNMFSDLGLTLPDALANSLSTKDATVQEEAVKILMSIQSGVEVNKGDLMTLFSDLGFDLPDELADSLASKENVVQTETLTLLSKIEEGYNLTEGNLKKIFATLGIEIPDELIKSLSSKDADTQKQAIELLGQLSAAEESERQPLIDKFNGLGVGVANEGLIKGLTSKESETKTKTETYIDNGVKQPLVSAEKTLYDQAHKDGERVVEGTNEGIEDKQDTSKGVIQTWVSNISKWFTGFMGIESPSKVFAEYGEYTVEGFNDGLSDNIDSTYGLVKDWANGISEGFNLDMPELDLSIPQLDYTPKTYNLGAFQSTMQMEMDAKMAEMEYQSQQLQNIMEENNDLLQQIKDQGIILDDNEFNRRYKRGAKKFYKQTGKQLGVAY